MVRSRAALKLRQSQFREKYIETSYIKLYAKPKYRKMNTESWKAYHMVQYYIENCCIPSKGPPIFWLNLYPPPSADRSSTAASVS